MRRHAIAVIALMLVGAGGGCWLWAPMESAGWQQFQGACWRMGALMAVAWLAYPEIQRIPSWMIPVFFFIAAVLLWRPRVILALVRLAPVAIPIILVLVILAPRLRRKP